METNVIGSNEKNKKRKLLALDNNKKIFFTHIGSVVTGAAIGASISRIIPLSNPDTTEEEKDADAANTPVGKAREKPKEEKSTKEKPEEEKPAEEESSEEKSTEEKPTEEKHTEEQEVPSQSEIDKIAEDLVKDSMIDARDVIDAGGGLHFTDYVTLNLPNGLETDGYVFYIIKEDHSVIANLVLADLDGDGVYDDVLSHNNGILKEEVVHIDNTTLNKIIADNHLTRSDIDQIVNGNGDINLAMTDIERRQIENDNIEDDIARLEEPNLSENSNGDVAQLSPKEEDLLLQDLMNGKNLAEVNSDEIILIDGENEIILFDDKDEIFREELAHHQIDQLSFPISPNATIDTEILESDMSNEISELSLDV